VVNGEYKPVFTSPCRRISPQKAQHTISDTTAAQYFRHMETRGSPEAGVSVTNLRVIDALRQYFAREHTILLPRIPTSKTWSILCKTRRVSSEGDRRHQFADEHDGSVACSPHSRRLRGAHASRTGASLYCNVYCSLFPSPKFMAFHSHTIGFTPVSFHTS
jgi:hypothetical protein